LPLHAAVPLKSPCRYICVDIPLRTHVLSCAPTFYFATTLIYILCVRRFRRGRFAAYSDAFFAIVATLSINAIAHFKESAVARLQDAIDACNDEGHASHHGCQIVERVIGLKLGALVVYIATFTVLAEIWLAHLLSLFHVQQVPRNLVVGNLLCLLPSIAVLPVAGAIASAYLTQTSSTDLWSSAMFVVALSVTSIAMLVHELAASECPGSGQQLQAVWPVLRHAQDASSAASASDRASDSSASCSPLDAQAYNSPTPRTSSQIDSRTGTLFLPPQLQDWQRTGVPVEAARRLAVRRAWLAAGLRISVLGASILVLRDGHAISAIVLSLSAGAVEMFIGGAIHVRCCTWDLGPYSDSDRFGKSPSSLSERAETRASPQRIL